MSEGPYRTPARPPARPRPQGDREALWLLAMFASTAVVPVVGDLVSGAPLGGSAGLGMLVASAALGGVWHEARRGRAPRQTRPRRDRTS